MIIYYDNKSSDNTINKELVELRREGIRLKKTVDVVNPVLELSLIGMDFNYIYLEEFERYYFIRNIESVGNGKFNFLLECDVLETYKDEILNSECWYERPLQSGDYQDISNLSEVRKEVEIFKSDVSLKPNNSDYVISVFSGGY